MRFIHPTCERSRGRRSRASTSTRIGRPSRDTRLS
jgi:hypothetical protein